MAATTFSKMYIYNIYMFRFQILQIFANSMWFYPGPSQVQQLSGTARVLAPGVYLFSKRAENILIQKDLGRDWIVNHGWNLKAC